VTHVPSTEPSEPSRSVHERAETYLRLRAEAELRVALRYPPVKPPREPRRTAALRTAATPVLRAAAAGRHITARPAASRLASRVWQPVHPAWQRALFWYWRASRGLRRRSSRPHGRPPASVCLERLTATARALASVDALSVEVALAVVDDLRTALAARSLIDPADLPGDPHRHWPGPAGPARTSGPMLAMPIGMPAAGQIEGEPVRYYLSALVIDGGQAVVAYSARFPPAFLHHRVPARRSALMSHLRETTATDDGGRSYRAGFSGGGSAGHWDGSLKLHPAVPAGVHWLDITLPGAETVRVDLATVPPPLPVTSVALPAESLADRYLDQQTLDLLRAGPREQADDDEPAAPAIAAALLAAGVLPVGSPALGRLATVVGQVGLELPAALADVTPCALPPDWLAPPAPRDSDTGPTRSVPVAAVLPEVDGARCAIVGLRSEADCATLQIEAHGWPGPRPFNLIGDGLFRWKARDDHGGSYAATHRGGGYGNGQASLRMELHPAIDPRARELQVILTGKTTEVSVTIPLDWQEGL
jgi:hypothetical protein